MSRSRRKPYITDGFKGSKRKQYNKRLANHVVRKAEGVPNGKAYRKYVDPWNINDYRYWFDKNKSPYKEKFWQYLRKGLNYLETSGKNYPPSFLHPGDKAYGALGLSRIAVMDVVKNYPLLSKFTPEEVFAQQEVYEVFAKNYADLLLRHYLGMDYNNMPQGQVFTVLQRVWFLGPGLYKKGSQLLFSREERAREYILSITPAFQHIVALKIP